MTSAVARFPDLADRAIAELCVVSHTFVAEIRRKVKAPPVKPDQVASVDGEANVQAPVDPGKEPEPEAMYDSTGAKIQPWIRDMWLRGKDESRALLSSISSLRSTLRNDDLKKDILYSEVNFQKAEQCLAELYSIIKTSLPYAVCYQCGGAPQVQPEGRCAFCHGRGFVSQFRWDLAAPKEHKELREKMKNKTRLIHNNRKDSYDGRFIAGDATTLGHGAWWKYDVIDNVRSGLE